MITNITDIQKYLIEKDADFNEVFEDNEWIAISIEWGDWKHSHKFIDYLMSEIGYKNDYEQITDSNYSDCYSSVHYYKKVV